MTPAIDHPPLPPLHAALARLVAAGIPHALGASGLLAANGLADVVHDWDVTCEADLDTLRRVFADVPHETYGNSGCHADHKLNLESNGIELIANFAFFVDGGVVRIPTLVSGTWNGVPLGSLEGWAVAYSLMGALEGGPKQAQRAARGEMLFTHLAAHGADRASVAALLSQPLPAPMRARLESLPPAE